MIRSVCIVASLMLGCASHPPLATGPLRSADLVLVGGTVYTMNPLRPRADGVAIVDGHIDAVGGDTEIRRRIGPKTRVIELAGRAATPGLVDGHCHLYGLGKSLEILSLRGLTSIDAIASAVERAAKARTQNEWIEGRGWDQNLWPSREFPDRGRLDGTSSPVALRRIDGHSLWVNAAAMRAAGISRETPDPVGGRIVRDAAGEPTGVFVDNAMALIEDKIPQPSRETIRRRILAGEQAALTAGLTGVHEMGIPDSVVDQYRALAKTQTLRLRVYAYLEGEGDFAALASRPIDQDPNGTARFILRGIKLYADGSLGSRSAALLEPYSDDPNNRGLVLTDPAMLSQAAELAVRGGWQLAVHAIGDRANRAVLDAFAVAQVPAERRFRIEHAQVVAPADFVRFATQGVVAAMQPTHATSDMPWAEMRLGHERVLGAYAWRTMIAAGVHVLGGSDFPIEQVAPRHALWAAVTRQDEHGAPDGGWYPDQRLTLDEALRLYTVEPAWVAFQEHRHGRLIPGYVADLTIFDHDLVPETLLANQVDLTIVAGEVVYDRRH